MPTNEQLIALNETPTVAVLAPIAPAGDPYAEFVAEQKKRGDLEC